MEGFELERNFLKRSGIAQGILEPSHIIDAYCGYFRKAASQDLFVFLEFVHT